MKISHIHDRLWFTYVKRLNVTSFCFIVFFIFITVRIVLYLLNTLLFRRVTGSNSQPAAPRGGSSSSRPWGATAVTWPPWGVWLRGRIPSTSMRSRLTSGTCRSENPLISSAHQRSPESPLTYRWSRFWSMIHKVDHWQIQSTTFRFDRRESFCVCLTRLWRRSYELKQKPFNPFNVEI